MNEGLDFDPARDGSKIARGGLSGLVRLRKNRYIHGNLWFSYDRVLRVGPAGPALFYYLNLPGPGKDARRGSGHRPDAVKNRTKPLQVRRF